jgi:16S rRNA C1402 N4-methylase RsmH
MITTMNIPVHKPVLTREVIEGLNIAPGKHYIDCTLGLGGHAQSILASSYPGGRLLGIDADPEAALIPMSTEYCLTSVYRLYSSIPRNAVSVFSPMPNWICGLVPTRC